MDMFGVRDNAAGMVAPIVTAPPVMPSPDDAAVKAAKKKADATLIARRGRAATIATQGAATEDTVG